MSLSTLTENVYNIPKFTNLDLQMSIGRVFVWYVSMQCSTIRMNLCMDDDMKKYFKSNSILMESHCCLFLDGKRKTVLFSFSFKSLSVIYFIHTYLYRPPTTPNADINGGSCYGYNTCFPKMSRQMKFKLRIWISYRHYVQ